MGFNRVEWGCEQGRGEPGVFALEADQASQWGTVLEIFFKLTFSILRIWWVFFGWWAGVILDANLLDEVLQKFSVVNCEESRTKHFMWSTPWSLQLPQSFRPTNPHLSKPRCRCCSRWWGWWCWPWGDGNDGKSEKNMQLMQVVPCCW